MWLPEAWKNAEIGDRIRHKNFQTIIKTTNGLYDFLMTGKPTFKVDSKTTSRWMMKFTDQELESDLWWVEKKKEKKKIEIIGMVISKESFNPLLSIIEFRSRVIPDFNVGQEGKLTFEWEE